MLLIKYPQIVIIYQALGERQSLPRSDCDPDCGSGLWLAGGYDLERGHY